MSQAGSWIVDLYVLGVVAGLAVWILSLMWMGGDFTPEDKQPRDKLGDDDDEGGYWVP